ncbi:ASCH domain-containing protein [Luteococcus sp. OSA5]|uniref:ASCH domain-containing protein n=1 Tax=Luteococcus sp. OSA5 TaxID=3401630 RepID=UPI003B428A27
MDLEELPIGEYAFPGPLRDRLVGAILSGEKTATSWLQEEEDRFGDEPTVPGYREVVVDSVGEPVCVTEVIDVQVLPLADVGDDHARAEGEGYADAREWREGHEEFWTSPDYVASLGEPTVAIGDDTPVCCCRFRVIHRC